MGGHRDKTWGTQKGHVSGTKVFWVEGQQVQRSNRIRLPQASMAGEWGCGKGWLPVPSWVAVISYSLGVLVLKTVDMAQG